MQVQSGVAALIYLPIILFMPNLTTNLQLSIDQWIYMFALGTVFTGIAHALFVQGLAHFSASFISILGCIQPLLGTLMGILILNEQPTISTWVGGGIILIAVIMATVATPVTENSDHNNRSYPIGRFYHGCTCVVNAPKYPSMQCCSVTSTV